MGYIYKFYRSLRLNQSVAAMVDPYGAALHICAGINDFYGVIIDQATSHGYFCIRVG